MRFALFSKTGGGKTYTMVYLALEYFLKGFKVYSNIHLKGVFGNKWVYIDNSNFTKVIDNSELNVVIVDEIGKTASQGRTHNAISMQNILAQSRKSFGEKSHFICTTQYENYMKLLEPLMDYKGFPQIVMRNEIDGLPLIIKLELERAVGRRRIFVPYTTMYLYKYLYRVGKYYDTNEEVDNFGDGTHIEMQKEYKEYIGQKGKLEELANKIQFEKKKNIAESKRLARAVIHNFK